MEQTSAPLFLQRLSVLGDALRRRQAAQGARFALLLGLALLALLLALAVGVPHIGALSLAMAALGGGWLWVLGARVIWPAIRRPSRLALARQVEQQQPELYNCLTTALYVAEHGEEAQAYRFSPSLLAAVRAQADRIDIREADGSARDGLAERRQFVAAACLALGMVCLSATSTGRVAWSRLYGALWGGERAVETGRATVVTSGNLFVPRGRPLELHARVIGAAEGPPRLYMRAPGDGWSTAMPMEAVAGASGRYVYRLAELATPLEYVVAAGTAGAPAARVNIVEPLGIVAWRVMVEPPAYTGLPPSAQEPGTPRIDALPGSRARFTAVCSQPLASAALATGAGAPQALEIADGAQASGELDIVSADALVLTLADVYQQTLRQEIELHILPDHPPAAVILEPAPRAELAEGQQALVKAQAADDYGLAEASLVYRLPLGDAAETRVPLPLASGAPHTTTAPREATMYHLLDLAAADLMPGDEVAYWVEVRDNDAVGGQKTARSAVHVLVVPSLGALYERGFAAQAETVDAIGRLRDAQQRINDQVRQIKERMLDRGAAPPSGDEDWLIRSQLEEVGREQQDVAQDLTEAAAELKQQAEELSRDLQLSYRTMDKYQRVQEILDKLLTDEMRQVMDSFQRMVAQLETQLDPKMLEGLQFELEDFEAQLDRALELLEASLTEQRLERLQHQLEALRDKQRALEDETIRAAEQPDAATRAHTLARRQESLRREAAAALEAMRETARELAEGNPDLARALEEALKPAEDGQLEEALQQAEQALREAQFEPAGRQQQQAGEMLAGLCGGVQQCMAGAQTMEADLRALLALCSRGVALSGELTALVERLTRLDQRAQEFLLPLRNELAQEFDHVRAEQRRLLEAFLEFARTSPHVDYEVAQLLGSSAESHTLAIDRARNGGILDVRLAGQAALGALNRALAKLLESFQQAASSGEGGSLQDFLRHMEQLARGQRSLNEDTERLLNEQGVRDVMEEMLRSAMAQRALRERVEELQRKYQDFLQQAGSLPGISEAMANVERMIQEGEDLERIRQEQDKILHHLLDAGRSLEQEEPDESRLAEAPSAEPFRPAPDPAALDQLKVNEQILRAAEGLSDAVVPPEYREDVVRYFRSMARDAVR